MQGRRTSAILLWEEITGVYHAFLAGASRYSSSSVVLCGAGTLGHQSHISSISPPCSTWVQAPLILPCPVSLSDGHSLQVRYPILVRKLQAKGNRASLMGLLTLTVKNVPPTANLNLSSLPNFQLLILILSSSLDQSICICRGLF